MSLLDKIDGFVSRFLPDKPIHIATSKFIHDPIWGTIELHPHEHTILDTPLLQRLRQIHQTGFAYATYPCATHTRFEHTLGVVHLAGRIAAQLQHKYPREAGPLRSTEQKVRLAALMHDTGHSAFSHTSEEIYGQCPDLGKLIGKGGAYEEKGPGEVLSYLITTSKAFRKFFRKLKNIYGKRLDLDVDDFASLILGRPTDSARYFEAEIISGPFDADKLDYFPRDGRAAGIELSLDIARLLHCLELAPEKNTKSERTRALVVNRGGFNALQQLLFARATLFSTVYHHHKVRACDCMIKGTYEVFKNSKKRIKVNAAFKGVNLKSAADFLHLTDADLLGEAYSHKASSLEHIIIHDVLYRRILKRTLTISTKTVNNFDSQTARYGDFFNKRSDPIYLRQLAIDIWKGAGGKKICSQAYVWVDIPKKPSFDKAGEARINLGPRNGKPELQRLREFIPVSEWVVTYNQYLTESFIFGPPNINIRRKLAKSAISLLGKRFGLQFKREAYAYDLRPKLT